MLRDDPSGSKGFHVMRVEGYVEAPLLHILAVLCEIGAPLSADNRRYQITSSLRLVDEARWAGV